MSLSLRIKTRRRLILAGLLMAVLGSLAAVLMLARSRNHDQYVERLRRNSLSMMAARQNVPALENMTRYLAEKPDDREILYAYALLRYGEPLPENRHISQSRMALQKLLSQDPRHLEGLKLMLQIQAVDRQDRSVLQWVERILEIQPEDDLAWRFRIVSLIRLRKFDEATLALVEAMKRWPQVMDFREDGLRVMNERQEAHAKILKQAQEWGSQMQGAGRSAHLMAFAHLLLNDRQSARPHLLAAARVADFSGSDAETRRLYGMLEEVGWYDEAVRMLSVRIRDDSPWDLREVLLHRLWQQQRVSDFLARSESFHPEQTSVPGGLLALRVLGLAVSGQIQPAQNLIRSLENRRWDQASQAWVPVLKSLFVPQTDSSGLVALRTAVAMKPDDPYLRHLMAEKCAAVSEFELALDHWKHAMELAPFWSVPRIRSARVLLDNGRLRVALQMAQDAVRLSPAHAPAIGVFTEAWLALDPVQSDEQAVGSLVQWLGQIQQTRPADTASLPAYLLLLLKTGRQAEAVNAMKQVLDRKPEELDTALVSQLLRIHDAYRMKLHESLRPHLLYHVPRDPELVLAWAAGQTGTEAAEKIESLIRLHSGELEWEMLRPRYLERRSDPAALEAWNRLVEQYPDRPVLLRRVLEVKDIWSDRARVAGLIERLRAGTGEEALGWRLYQVRLGLESNVLTEQKQAVEDLKQLAGKHPAVDELQLLLAEVYEREGDWKSAMKHLDTAAHLRPRDADLILRQVMMSIRIGKVEEARIELDRLLKLDTVQMWHRMQIARLLASLGRVPQAIEILESLYSGQEGVPKDVFLADLYERTGKPARARAIHEGLMEPPSLPGILGMAGFLIRQGEVEAGLGHLKGLEALNLPVGQKDLVLGDFHRNLVGRSSIPDATCLTRAQTHYRAAADHQPGYAALWIRWIETAMNLGNWDLAFEVARRGVIHHPAHAGLKWLAGQEEFSYAMRDRPQLPYLVTQILVQSEMAETSKRAVEWLKKYPKPDEKSLMQFEQIAAQSPGAWPLQSLHLDLLESAGRLTEALDIAWRMARALPGDNGPNARAAGLMKRLKRWSELLALGERLQESSQEPVLQAQAWMAEARLNMGAAGKAVSELKFFEPVLFHADRGAGESEPGRIYLTALIRNDEERRAWLLIEPLLKTAVSWRRFGMHLAVNELKDPETAAAWLRQIASASQPETPEDAIVFAQNWYELGRRWNRADWRRRGYERVGQAARSASARPQIMVLYAMLAQQEGDAEEARRQYEKIMILDGNLTVARNNLAMMLMEEGKDLDRALVLIQSAVEKDPGVASYHDTQAILLARMNRWDEAVRSWEKAIELEPENLDWRITLAENLLKKGKVAQAMQQWSRILAQVDRLESGVKSLSGESREKLDRLRAALDAARTGAGSALK